MPTTRHSFSQILLGQPLETAAAPHQAIGKLPALAVFASDALSSVAYATEEILVILALAGAAYFYLSVPLALAISALLIVLTISYRQTIFAYPGGGGVHRGAGQPGRAAGADRWRRAAHRLHPHGRRFDLFGCGPDCFRLPGDFSFSS